MKACVDVRLYGMNLAMLQELRMRKSPKTIIQLWIIELQSTIVVVDSRPPLYMSSDNVCVWRPPLVLTSGHFPPELRLSLRHCAIINHVRIFFLFICLQKKQQKQKQKLKQS